MKSRIITIRFYPEREADKTALDRLDHKDRAGFKSNNEVVVAAINDYFSRRERESELRKREDAFLQKILETIREGMRESGAANLGGLIAVLQNAASVPNSGESAETVDEESLNTAFDFVDSL